MYCSKCGKKQRSDAVYCDRCGNEKKTKRKENKMLLILIVALTITLLTIFCVLILTDNPSNIYFPTYKSVKMIF